MAQSLKAETSVISELPSLAAPPAAGKARTVGKKAKRDSEPPDETLELRYFKVMAKGLGPALVLEHSGVAWKGNADLEFDAAEHWAELKPSTPFGQMPVLAGPGGFQLAQTVAIINYVAKVAGSEVRTRLASLARLARCCSCGGAGALAAHCPPPLPPSSPVAPFQCPLNAGHHFLRRARLQPALACRSS